MEVDTIEPCSSDPKSDIGNTAENKTFKTIKEGTAEILVEGHVFYNPVQEFNRDISICVLNTFSKIYQVEKKLKSGIAEETENNSNQLVTTGIPCEAGISILEALSATGLRSIRYAKEIAGVKKIVANDISISACESIEQNIKRNNVENLIVASQSDAMTLMYLSTSKDKRFNAIDLDPYGCPSKFLDGAVQSIEDGGLLLVTATDMAVLAGNTPESCYLKYGAISLKSKACHEMAIRILLKCIESHAILYGKYIKPLLCISVDFYIRVFVRVYYSPNACKKSSSKQSLVYQCTGCESFTLQPLGILKPNPTEKNLKQFKFATPTGPFVNTNCEHCNHRHHMGGPIWSDPIHDEEFLGKLLELIQDKSFPNLMTFKRIYGILSVIQEELNDVPLYYTINKMCNVLKLEMMPTLTFRSALLHAGYRVSFSHACKTSIKTDAPAKVLWDILRCWAKSHPVKDARLIDGTPLKNILAKESPIEYNLTTPHPKANPTSRKDSLSRFPENPAAHWGPGTRATLMIGDERMLKSFRNQDKRKKKREQRNGPAEKKKIFKIDDQCEVAK